MPGFAGFDCSIYPGDAVMDALQTETNLVWCGYYLAPAPSHHDTSWMGKREQLAASGWGFGPVYVGQQVVGPGSLNPSAAAGLEDGTDAAGLMTSEGFPPGSFVYLDLENGPPLGLTQRDYVANWCDTVVAAGFGAGVYCSHLLAISVHTLRPTCRIWAFAVNTIAAHPVQAPYPDPNPSGCGYIGAFAWQLGQHCLIAVPPSNVPTLTVDLDSASTADPSAP